MRQGFGDSNKEYVDDFRAFFANLYNRGLLLTLNSRPCNMQTKEAIVYSTMECHGEYHCGPLNDADDGAYMAPNNTNSVGLVFSHISANEDRVCESCKPCEKRQKTQGISPDSDLKTELLDVAEIQRLNDSDVFASLGPVPTEHITGTRFDVCCLRPSFHFRHIARRKRKSEIFGDLKKIEVTVGVAQHKVTVGVLLGFWDQREFEARGSRIAKHIP
ncbi:uncharacterized protein RCC_02893 [Ramularia collo-cygni]|uniref:Uncharacterized protein n=1 Tax=Ramularia collo-cygni TaxID=112498 RepID=A0A2D3UP80_9PEZI|nr:uncharacterized protein RCC_02893 [Ramularia collo-cygni]CZT17061.1 uncharacterized protein RCC_02893 [Ramularia collo-cygni]